MSEFSLSPELTADDLVEFEIFVNFDNTATDKLLSLGSIEASPSVINFAMRSIGWKGYQYKDDTDTLIGYGTSDDVDGIGLTEDESYQHFISKWKDRERKFKRLFPLQTISQTQFDALLSMYFFTGDFTYIGTGSYKLYIGDYIKNRQWNYVATAMIKTNYQRALRRQEASILMLADYGTEKDRDIMRESGLQDIRKRYPALLNDTQQRQVEYVYYAETGRFLPKMTQGRMRQIVKIYNKNN